MLGGKVQLQFLLTTFFFLFLDQISICINKRIKAYNKAQNKHRDSKHKYTLLLTPSFDETLNILFPLKENLKLGGKKLVPPNLHSSSTQTIKLQKVIPIPSNNHSVMVNALYLHFLSNWKENLSRDLQMSSLNKTQCPKCPFL